MLSERKRRAYALAEQALTAYKGHPVAMVGNFTIADLERIAARNNAAVAYREKYGDPIGAAYIRDGMSEEEVRATRPQWHPVIYLARQECACVLPNQSCPACIQAAAIVAGGVAPDGFPF